MRRGWKPEWDTTEKLVWTLIAFGWLGILATGLIVPLPWEWFNKWLTIHAIVFVLMWLRRMVIRDKPSGKDRDR